MTPKRGKALRQAHDIGAESAAEPAAPPISRNSEDLCVHELIEAQARRTPEATALIAGDAELSYHDLDRQADALAGELRRRGVGPEVIVGVHLDRSTWLVVTMLAILKAGGAFAPMDPSSPIERLAEVPVAFVISREDLAPRLVGTDFRVVCLEHLEMDWNAGRHRSGGGDGARVLPANLAYVIYTSGSTGSPKGVAVEHRSLTSSTLARGAMYPAPRAFLLLSAVAFDSALAGIFGTLTRGGVLCLPPSGVEADTRELARVLAQHKIDTLLVLPSLYDLLLDSAQRSDLASLRTVTVAGERCPPGLLSKSYTHVPAVEVVNEYGPTEGTIWSTAWRAPAGEASNLTTVPIGRAIDGVRVQVMDSHGRPVPLGQTGELCIAGAGLARGYLGRPDLTAASFVPDPAGPAGGRLYRTGDLARRRVDGELEFVGRIDRQVKIQGFRVEPAEIEEALLRHPGVRQAVVMEVPHAEATALAAVIAGDGADPAEIRGFLRERLPAYMVPTTFHRVDVMPTMPNGKTDYRALANLLAEADGVAGDSPRSPVERVVAHVWAQVLRRERIGRGDSFPDLGGSLDAMRIALHLTRRFGVEVPLLWVYETPTVTDLALWLESNAVDAQAYAAKWLATDDDTHQPVE